MKGLDSARRFFLSNRLMLAVGEFRRSAGARWVSYLSIARYLDLPEEAPAAVLQGIEVTLRLIAAFCLPLIGFVPFLLADDLVSALNDFIDVGLYLASVGAIVPYAFLSARGSRLRRSLITLAVAALLLAMPYVIDLVVDTNLGGPFGGDDYALLLLAPFIWLPYVSFRVFLWSSRQATFIGRLVEVTALLLVLVMSSVLSALSFWFFDSNLFPTEEESDFSVWFTVIAWIMPLAILLSFLVSRWSVARGLAATIVILVCTGSLALGLATLVVFDGNLSPANGFAIGYALAVVPFLYGANDGPTASVRAIDSDVNQYVSSARTLSVAVVLVMLLAGNTVRSIHDQVHRLSELRLTYSEHVAEAVLWSLISNKQLRTSEDALMPVNEFLALKGGLDPIGALVDAKEKPVDFYLSDSSIRQSTGASLPRIGDTKGLNIEFFLMGDGSPFLFFGSTHNPFTLRFDPPERLSSSVWLIRPSYSVDCFDPVFSASWMPSRSDVLDPDEFNALSPEDQSLYMSMYNAVSLLECLQTNREEGDLRSVASKYGYNSSESDSQSEILTKATQALTGDKVSVPSTGLSLVPLEAVIALSLLMLVLLVVLHGLATVMMRSSNLSNVPWLLLDRNTALDRLAGRFWLGLIFSSPLLVVSFVVIAFASQVELDGISTPDADLMWFSSACLLYLLCGMIVSTRIVIAISQQANARERQNAA